MCGALGLLRRPSSLYPQDMLPTVKTDLFAVNQMVATWDVPAPLRMLQKNVNLVLLRIYTAHA